MPTIYDVARSAGVSIASVSRVLNGRRNPRPETRDRVLQAVAELGFIPDGAARALSVRLKEVAGVIIRLPWASRDPEDLFADEEDSLQFPDMINRGIAEAAQRRGFDILVRSVDLDEHDPGGRILTLARKSDGIILHDRVLEPDQLGWLARQVPVVTMAGVATPTTANVRSDNTAGMRDLARHLLHDHGYRSISYIGGHVDSPDSIARFGSLATEVADAGAEFLNGPEWQGNYTAGGGARVINNLLARHTDIAARDRLRERPDRHRRAVRAGTPWGQRPGGRGGDRVRRHPGGPAPAHPADHGAPAHPRTRRRPPSRCSIQ